MPAVTGLRSSSANAIGELAAERLCPTTNPLVADLDPTGGQPLLHHPQAQGEAEVESDREADHRGRKMVAGIEQRAQLRHTRLYGGTRSSIDNVTMPGEWRKRSLPFSSKAASGQDDEPGPDTEIPTVPAPITNLLIRATRRRFAPATSEHKRHQLSADQYAFPPQQPAPCRGPRSCRPYEWC